MSFSPTNELHQTAGVESRAASGRHRLGVADERPGIIQDVMDLFG